MSITMEDELRRVRELYDPRRDSTDIFAKQYRLPNHDEEAVTVHACVPHESVRNSLPPFHLRPPVKPANSYTKPASKQPEYGHFLGYSEEERRLHFDPTYRAHRRLIRTGHAASIAFAITFVLSAIAFAFHFIERPYYCHATIVIQIVLASIGVAIYLLRALVNWRVRKALGTVFGKAEAWGCERHMECYEQRYRLYGGKGLEIAFSSFVVVMITFCAIAWFEKI